MLRESQIAPIKVRPSTLIGLAVMDALDAGMHVTVNIHGMPEPDRARLLSHLEACGWTRKDSPENGGHKGAKFGTAFPDVNLWPERTA